MSEKDRGLRQRAADFVAGNRTVRAVSLSATAVGLVGGYESAERGLGSEQEAVVFLASLLVSAGGLFVFGYTKGEDGRPNRGGPMGQ